MRIIVMIAIIAILFFIVTEFTIENVKRKKRIHQVVFWLTFVLTVVTTIVFYCSLHLTFFVYEDGTQQSVMSYIPYKGFYLLFFPAVSCLVLLISGKFKWSCVLSAMMIFVFSFITVFDAGLNDALNAFTSPWIGTSGKTSGEGVYRLDQILNIFLFLCFIRFVLAIAQAVANHREQQHEETSLISQIKTNLPTMNDIESD